jgi:ribosome-binding protein aMBF1 (putative translation factor)
LHGIGGQAETDRVSCPVIHIDPYRKQDELPPGSVTIEQLISNSEQHAERKAALEEARQWIAESLYKDDETLRTLRLRKGLSQAKLATLIGTTQPHIARVENGTSDVQVGTLVRMANALATDVLVTVKAFLKARQETSNGNE